MTDIDCLELIEKFISSNKGSILQKETTNIWYAKTNIFFLSILKNNFGNETYYCENNMFNFLLMSKIKNMQINKKYLFTKKSPNLTIIEKIN